MRYLLRSAVILLFLTTLLTGVIYPLAITGIAQILFTHQANGSLIYQDGHPVGSTLIGQPFNDPRYFWGRPSATPRFPYNSAASSGSNLGPSNPELAKAVRARIATLRAADPEDRRPIPVDLVTTSGSGLDPHISIAAALYQLPRVAKARGLDEETVHDIVLSHVRSRDLGILGEPVVNVLDLNMELEVLR